MEDEGGGREWEGFWISQTSLFMMCLKLVFFQGSSAKS